MKQPQVLLCTILHIQLRNMLQSTIQTHLQNFGVPFMSTLREILVYVVSITKTR